MADAQIILRFASGFPLLVLGAVLLAVRPRRPTQLTFAAFAILWGLQLVSSNYGRVVGDVDTHYTFLLLSFAFSNAAQLFLVNFATQTGLRRGRWIPLTLSALIATAGLLVIVFWPRLILDGVRTADGGGVVTSYGPLATPLFFIPSGLAILYALTTLYIAMRRARPGTLRHRMRGMMIAFALYACYSFPILAISSYLASGGPLSFATGMVTLDRDTQLLQGGYYILGTLYLAAIAIHAAARPPPPEGVDVPLLLAFVVPATGALFDIVLTRTLVPTETAGFWRFIMIGVLVYTLANYQLFDLELKMKRFAVPGIVGLIAIFGVPILVGLSMGNYGVQAMLFIVLPEAVGTAGVLVFHEKVAEALFPGVSDEPDYHHQRRLELYKVALEDALSHGRTPDDPGLRDIRLRFGVNDKEHGVLVLLSGYMHRPEGVHELEISRGAKVLDRYRVERVLGRGTNRVTYLATDTKTRRYVAIKSVHTGVLDGAASRLLVRDARLGASIAHPNVLAIFDVAEVAGTTHIVMDYADRGNLQDHLHKDGVMDVPEAVRFLTELLGALEAIHERGIVHANLKPKNVLLDNDGSVLLADFSAAHVGDGRLGTEGGMDEAMQALLDVLYLSPEQLRGEPPTAQSDLYVAAVLFHQALTNRYYLPIQGKDDSMIRDLIMAAEPELRLPNAPGWVSDLLGRALAKDPAERPTDATTMLEEVRDLAGLVPVGRWPRAPRTQAAAV